MMKSTKASKFIFMMVVTGFISFSIVSCKNKGANNVATQISDETIKKEIVEYTYPINSVFEVTNLLNTIDASYIIGIANDPANVEKYFTEQSKAVNLGVYTADLAYATTYNQKAEIQKYFKATESLVSSLSLSSAFNKDLPNQIESNIDNKEKLVNVVTSMFQDAYTYLNKQGRSELSYLILSGTVIEGLYLTTHISYVSYDNPKIIEAILFQKAPLAKLEKLMEGYKDSELSKSVFDNIKSINAIFAEVEGTTSLTKKQYDELTNLLNQIHTNIVK